MALVSFFSMWLAVLALSVFFTCCRADGAAVSLRENDAAAVPLCTVCGVILVLFAAGCANVLRAGAGAVLAAGLVTLIAVQTVLNLAVVTNLLPSTGIALPFFSYGGTALAVNLGEMGIVLSISRSRNKTKKQEVIL